MAEKDEALERMKRAQAAKPNWRESAGKKKEDSTKKAKDALSQVTKQAETAKSKQNRGDDLSEKETMTKGVPTRKAAPAPSAQPPFIAEHTVVSGDTLSGIAAKYYNSAAREKWMAIYEANKEIIGDNPSLIRPGQVLKIPKLD
ncbi:MAG: LysM peptidoglycan-binding domain-containing protein [Chloroflexi bacterium]|nr:MAG: LysM peptidoglycan-binding domain-containing protein [Chloroflexota bacterium]